MKYPVGAAAMFWRELACWFAGHSWKFPQRAYRHIEGEELAKWERTHRRGGGNPYYTNVASWGARCRRCRTTTHDSYYVWWREIGWAVRNFFGTWRICFNGPPWNRGEKGHAYSRIKWPAYMVSCLIAGPLFAFEQVYLCTFSFGWDWPALPGHLASDALHKVWDWIEARTEHFDWWPPVDPTDATEIGFWMPRTESRERPELRIRVLSGIQ